MAKTPEETYSMQEKTSSIFNLTVVVAALGYFVDIYDLLLFGIIRVKSLTSLGLDATAVRDRGEFIISIQMAGLLIGGIIWGIMGDKKGRISVLFGSIILYSLANIANGFVHNVNQYALVRFIAGVGLAGELGAGITLVSELLPKEKRGLGTSLVAGIGITGAVAAYFISRNRGRIRADPAAPPHLGFRIRNVPTGERHEHQQGEFFHVLQQRKTVQKIYPGYSHRTAYLVCGGRAGYFFKRIWK